MAHAIGFGLQVLPIDGIRRHRQRHSLDDLNAVQLKNLMRKGLMARIYLHLLSLENFARLLQRKAARITASASD